MKTTVNASASTHCTSVVCAVAAQDALDFMADGVQLGRWALGCWGAEPVAEGLVRGRSLFDESTSWVLPVADCAHMTVVYHVGEAPDALEPRIHAVVRALEDREGPRCRISLLATRGRDMDDQRWLRLVRCHELEVLLIKAQMTRGSSISLETKP
jgi:hypothetical protein